MGRLFYLPLGDGEDVYGSALLFVAWRLLLSNRCVVQSGRWLIARRFHPCEILRMIHPKITCVSTSSLYQTLFIASYYITYILGSYLN